MGFASITEEQARYAHHSHYTKPFEVVLMDRSGQWDLPPFSWVYGISDFGSWSGLISTDGEKIVVTQSTYMDLSTVKNTFEFKKEDIESLDFGAFKTTFNLKNKIKGLTKGGTLKALLPLTIYGILALPFLPSKIFQARLKDEFKNIEKFKKLLGK